jgi:hypothetical protein
MMLLLCQASPSPVSTKHISTTDVINFVYNGAIPRRLVLLLLLPLRNRRLRRLSHGLVPHRVSSARARTRPSKLLQPNKK